ncbi:MAG: carbamoyltransferase HypF [Candidatus Hydrothermarchaeales archaeon]
MRAKIFVQGIVQGVGFRPFIYRIAKQNSLKGFVRNVGNGVEILVEGGDDKIESFLRSLKTEAPPLSRIDEIKVNYEKVERYKDFQIVKSKKSGISESIIPPDVCICDRCLKEVSRKGDRRHDYPFTVCVDCGARFTIIKDLPYDRENTTMDEFPMCKDCQGEYENPIDRRYHAEPTCCPICGPRYYLFKGEKKLNVKNPIKEAANLLEDYKIVALMGLGGTHLACKLRDDIVSELRRRLRRLEQPFAIMARDIKTIKDIAHINEKEEYLLRSLRRPIVVLRKKKEYYQVSPRLDSIGIMLPYSALHHILFSYTDEPAFIMTSANIPGEPMLITQEEITASNLSDYSLVHNRRIENRTDDSVIRIVDGREAFIRRSRGYVPEPIELNFEIEKTVLALGAELNVAICISKNKRAFLSQYIGNTTKVRTIEFLEGAIKNLIGLTRCGKIDVVAVDLHPTYNTTMLGEELSEKLDADLMRIQHHHAHIASLMAENRIDEIVGIASDGIGYGLDGTFWGGEVFVSKNGEFERLGSLDIQPMPGGDLATRFPARMVAGVLYKRYEEEELKGILSRELNDGFKNEKEMDLVLKQLERNFNVAQTTSTGRILDAVSALLNNCYERTYEGEPAMKLEGLASEGEPSVDIPIKIDKSSKRYILDTTAIVDAVLLAKDEDNREDIAASAQNAVAKGLAEISIICAKKSRIEKIGMSGGVAYNDAIISTIRREVEESGFTFLSQTKAPPGDGGISLGQAILAQRSKS